ncbi:MAG: GCN5-related N-acetyltransferase [Cyanobacteria bacterium RYN_339]|nr:GCN5-related N-acetyltransferase [Cyanobacteria bacterium RYN_339]
MAPIALLAGDAARAYAPLVPLQFQEALAEAGASCLAFGLMADGQPAGILLAQRLEDPAGADLLLVHVVAEHQRQGHAGRLVSLAEARLRADGVRWLRTFYEAGGAATEALLARGGWDAPEASMMYIVSSPASVAPAGWMKPRDLGPRFEIFSWTALTAAEAEGLVGQPWIPEDLHPAAQLDGWCPLTSVGLRLDGEVVGWVINHLQDEATLSFTCSFVRPDLQRLGRVFALYREAVARMVRAGIPTAIWHVPLRHPGMAAFAARWMLPYAHASTTIMRTTKQL